MHKTYAFASAISAGLLLAACSGEPEAPGAVTATAATSAAAKSSAAVEALPSSDDLRSKAESAMAAQRLLAPAGDNALEYFLALRAQSPGDAGVQVALVDLQPQLVIAAEQAMANGHAPEAKRLVALLTRVNGDAPALPRLRLSVAEAERLALAQIEADSDAARAEAQRAQAELQRQAEANAARLAAERGAPSVPAPTPASEPGAGTVTASPTQPLAVATTPARSPTTTTSPPIEPAATPVPTPQQTSPAAATATAPTQPRLVHDESPRYPPPIGGTQFDGQVLVGFTISPDGSVLSPTVISSNLPRTYQRAALAAATRWKFEATGRSQQGQRSVAFKN